MARDEEFARVLRHSVFHATLVHGAVPVWMPRLEPEVMQEIEGKHLTFGQACGAGSCTVAPIGGFERWWSAVGWSAWSTNRAARGSRERVRGVG